MSLPHALLTALIERPCSGSELAERFDRSIGYFWQATHQQIYRELARLEAAGFVQGSLVDGARGGKKTYLVLPAGLKELRRWLTETQAPSPIRDELMVRLRAEAVIGPTRLIEKLERLAGLHREKLKVYREIEARDFSQKRMTRDEKLRWLVLKAGIDFETQRIAVCKEAIAILKAS
ncbi:PadR family transcriptional regulator [Bradyrhizobium sp. WSM 1738]|uniref:PadR family transcriptional regulator n=1 Tax=Bradyrhizobium hereditatis TaxID=2821405 RepID=UPI001CE38414|nr:PadR family transcriptional regulator [Bradyrhizobium hereditatis]MCA6117411.1 PadR family transcriptional regulator [Bradyrhizobium hereditatis]